MRGAGFNYAGGYIAAAAPGLCCGGAGCLLQCCRRIWKITRGRKRKRDFQFIRVIVGDISYWVIR